MAFPVTVSSSRSSADAPGKYGPFFVGSNRYLILSYYDTGAFQGYLEAWKSTDGGSTWNMVGGEGPATAQSEGFPAPYTAAQSTIDPTKIYAFTLDPGTFQVAPVLFDASTDSWGTYLAEPSPPPSFIQIGTGQLFIIACHRTSDNAFILALPGDIYTDASSEQHQIVSFAVYDVAANSWSSWADMGYTDYASVIGWHQVPCGIVLRSDGKISLFMQQITHSVPNSSTTGSVGDGASLSIPWYVDSLFVECWGGGGGGAGGNSATPVNTAPGGGGGSGQYATGTVAVTPNTTVGPASVGAGGASDTGTGSGGDGGATTFLGVSAGGGSGGTIPAGGGGAHDGGNGYNDSGGFGGGGGGGGSDNADGSGTDGSDGTIYTGPPGSINGGDGGFGGSMVSDYGLGQGSGGSGGSWDPTAPGFADGGNGNQPGGGGGGGGYDCTVSGIGGDGQVNYTWTPVQGTVYRSRLWQQVINSDNSLGTLEEISDGEFAMQAYEMPVIPMPFDCVALAGSVAIAFSGAYATTEYANIEAGRGVNADPITFTLALYSSGNSGANVNPSPALSGNGTTAYLSYTSTPGGTPTFNYREDTGSGFGAPTSFGSFADEFTRVQAGAGPGDEITFGTPTQASDLFQPPV